MTARTRSRGPLFSAFMRTVRNPLGLFGLLVLAALVAVALTAPVIAPYDPTEQHPGFELRGPSSDFPLGTDDLGRDVLSRVIFGTRPSLVVSLIVAGLGGGVGILIGLVVGYLGGLPEAVAMRVFDALLAFPSIMLGFVIVAVLGPGTTQVAYAIALAAVPGFARLARSLALRERNQEYVLAAHCAGATPVRIVMRHVLPNALPPMFVNIALLIGQAVLAESSLAFLGLGTQPPNPSWGAMLNESRAYLRVSLWLAIWPGSALALLLLGVNYLADAMRDAFDPRRVNVGL